MAESLQAVLADRLERAPDHRALAWYDAGGRLRWRSFQDFHQAAARAAARLRAAGLERGEVCVIVSPSSESAATILLAVLLAGAVPLLVAPPTLQRFNSDLARILQRTVARSRARLLVYEEALLDGDSPIPLPRRARLVAAAELIAEEGEALVAAPAARAPAALQLTSGTTGMPRIAMWSHQGVLAALDGMARAMKLTDDDACFNWTPLYHDMGLVNNFLLCLCRGVPLVMMKPQEFVRRPALWLRGLSDSGATITWSPNFGFALASERADDRELRGVRLGRVRAFWNAAERVHLRTIRDFETRFAAYGLRRDAVKTNFGCVENVGGATFSDVDGPLRVDYVDPTALQRRLAVATDPKQGVAIVGVGRPNPGMRCVAVDWRGRRLADGRIGELAFRTPSRLLGYMGDARASRRARLGPYLRTGDLGYLRGQEVFWVGRVRERITVRGKKLDPSDFEAVLDGVRGLRAGCFAAFGVDAPEQGTERIVVVAEVKQPLDRPPREIHAEVLERAFRQLDISVSEVILVRPATLAKTSSGKRRHRRFRELYLSGALAPFVVASAKPRRGRV